MRPFEPLPEQDQDRQLAERIGRILAEGRSLSDTDDELVELLVEYRDKRNQQIDLEDHASERSWKRMQPHLTASREIADQSNKIVWLLNRPAWMYWTAAAALVVMALLFALVMPFSSEPAMIANSNEQIISRELPDGSVVKLRPHSQLYRVEKTADHIRYRLDGEAFFNVEDQGDRQFQVQSGDALITVVGTRFNVSDWGGTTRVFLEEGKLRFASLDKPESVMLEPGQSSEIDFKGLPETPKVTTGKEYTDWLNNTLTFENRPARYIIQELEQHYQIKITAPDSVKNVDLSGHLLLDSKDKSLKDLGTVLNGHFEATGPKQYRFIP